MITYSEGMYAAVGDPVEEADVQVWADVDDSWDPGEERVVVHASDWEGFEARIFLFPADVQHLLTQPQSSLEEMRQLSR